MAEATTKQNADQASGSLRTSAMKGGLFLFGRQVGSIFLKLIGVLLISRVLGPERYGIYVAAFGVYQYALSLGQAGLGICLLRQEGEVTERHYGTLSSLLGFMAIAIVILVVGASGLISSYVGLSGFQPVFVALLLALPLQLMVLPPQVRLERELNYRAVAMVELGGQIIYYVVALPLVLSGFGPMGLAISWVVQQGTTMIIAYVSSKTLPRFAWDKKIAREMASYSISYSLANWTWQLRSLINPLIVAPLLGAYAVGIIGMTVGIMEMLGIIKTIAWRLSVVVIGKFQNDFVRVRQAMTQGMELQTLAIGSMMLGFSWFGHWLIPMVFGARWLPVLIVFPYIALSYLTNAPFNMHSAVMSVMKRNRELAACFVVHVLLFALVARLTVPHFGMIGYGFGELAALPAYLLLHVLLSRRIGSPNYALTAIWWTGAALGLFWREIGWIAIVAPFVALLAPISVKRLRGFLEVLLQKRSQPSAVAEVA